MHLIVDELHMCLQDPLVDELNIQAVGQLLDVQKTDLMQRHSALHLHPPNSCLLN